MKKFYVLSVTAFLLFALSSCGKQQIKKQDINRKGSKTAATAINITERMNHNDEVAFSNNITDNIARLRLNVRNLYDQFDQFQNNPETYIRFGVEGMHRVDDRGLSDGRFASTRVQTMRDQYNTLKSLNSKLRAYIRLEDYMADGASRGIKIIEDMSGIVFDLAAERNRLRRTIYADRKNVLANSHGKVYRMMIDIIAHEEDLLENLDANYRNESTKVLDETIIIKSYLETEDLLAAFEKNFTIQKPDPAHRFLRMFPDSLSRLQKAKQRAVDKNSYNNKNSAHHVSEFVKFFTEYFNNDILAVFEHYVKVSAKESPLLSRYPKYIPVLRYKKNDYTVRSEHRSFSVNEVQPIEVKPQSDTLSLPVFDILNGYVKALNARTKSLDNLRPILRNFQCSLNYLKKKDDSFRQHYTPRFYDDSFLFPKTDYALLRKRTPELIPEYSVQLLGQLENIQEIMLECEPLRDELWDFFENRLYLTVGFGRAEEILQRFSVLFDKYRSMKDRLYKDILAIYDAYPDNDPENPWKVTSGVMRRAVDVAKSTLHAVKGRFSEDKSQVIAADPLLFIRRDMVVNEAKYMGSIRRLGRNNGHCPYNPYEDMADELKSMIKKLGRIDTYVKNGRYDKYNDYVYVFNRIALNYNKFAELAKGDIDSAKADADRPVYVLIQATAF